MILSPQTIKTPCTPQSCCVHSCSNWYNGEGAFYWSWPAGFTDGLVLGPLDLTSATGALDMKWTLSKSGGISSWTIVTPGLNLSPQPINIVGETVHIYRTSCTCGNRIVEGVEQCDGGPCCTSSCTFALNNVICRAVNGKHTDTFTIL